jgi:hypothetical protein
MKTLFFVLPVFAFAQAGAIEGVATDKLTKAPVAGVRVRMTAAGEPGRYYDVTTDSSGVYRFESLPVGSYSPSVDRTEGYFPPDPMQMALRRIRLDVKEAETAKWDVELTPASVLRGRVYDPDGKPLPAAMILAHGVLFAKRLRFVFPAPTQHKLGVSRPRLGPLRGVETLCDISSVPRRFPLGVFCGSASACLNNGCLSPRHTQTPSNNSSFAATWFLG